MSERKTAKWSGWLLATVALVLAGVISISGAPSQESRISGPAKSSVAAGSAGADVQNASVRAETEVLELQLD